MTNKPSIPDIVETLIVNGHLFYAVCRSDAEAGFNISLAKDMVQEHGVDWYEPFLDERRKFYREGTLNLTLIHAQVWQDAHRTIRNACRWLAKDVRFENIQALLPTDSYKRRWQVCYELISEREKYHGG